jgi:tRNA(fMet)-specific endonuclease VapC
VNYLLDTNACIALINGHHDLIRTRFQQVVEAGHVMYISALVEFELWYGVAKSIRTEANTLRLEAFLAGPLNLLPFQEQDARVAGALRAALEAQGKPIGAYDLLIAGQAIRHNMILVTANVKEFGRVKNLVWEDWAKPKNFLQ